MHGVTNASGKTLRTDNGRVVRRCEQRNHRSARHAHYVRVGVGGVVFAAPAELVVQRLWSRKKRKERKKERKMQMHECFVNMRMQLQPNSNDATRSIRMM
jgi:hypothetical protein